MLFKFENKPRVIECLFIYCFLFFYREDGATSLIQIVPIGYIFRINTRLSVTQIQVGAFRFISRQLIKNRNIYKKINPKK